jgi:hypothetical protein
MIYGASLAVVLLFKRVSVQHLMLIAPFLGSISLILLVLSLYLGDSVTHNLLAFASVIVTGGLCGQ